ncbi:MAG TPA: peptidylprolyl isomerase [Casimicrobiaceae bacterium]|nr:peptidylprolyl isomerase [Casimicrobiaceae bacterium]
MRTIRFEMLFAYASSLLVLMLLGACHAQQDAGSAAKSATGAVAATVNGVPISQATVERMVKQGANSGHADSPEARKAVLERLTLQSVIAQEAVKEGLDRSLDVTEQLDAIRQAVLANAYVQDFINKHPVTDDMLQAEYERIKTTMTGTEYKVRHILVDKEADAKDIIARLKKDPGAFAQLAKDKSKDQGSRANGGELGWFDPRRMVPEFGAAVGKLEKGKFTLEPVKTQFGYHVIQVEDSRPIQAPPLEEVKPQLAQQLQQQEVIKQVDALKAQAKIELPAVPASAPPAPAAAPPAPAAAPPAPAAAPTK